jgi:hypothetical protein
MADDVAPQDTAPADQQAAAPATGEAALGDAGKQALDTERAARKEAEKTAKALQRELEQVRLSSLSEAEKAVELARAETRTETLRAVGGRLVDAEVRATAAGRLPSEQVDALLEGLDRSRFITDDGDVDRDALTKWVERIAPSTPPAPSRFGDADQGVRKTTPPGNKDEREFVRNLFRPND